MKKTPVHTLSPINQINQGLRHVRSLQVLLYVVRVRALFILYKCGSLGPIVSVRGFGYFVLRHSRYNFLNLIGQTFIARVASPLGSVAPCRVMESTDRHSRDGYGSIASNHSDAGSAEDAAASLEELRSSSPNTGGLSWGRQGRVSRAG